MPCITPVFSISAFHSNQNLYVDNIEKALGKKSNVVVLHVILKLVMQLLSYMGRI